MSQVGVLVTEVSSLGLTPGAVEGGPHYLENPYQTGPRPLLTSAGIVRNPPTLEGPFLFLNIKNLLI